MKNKSFLLWIVLIFVGITVFFIPSVFSGQSYVVSGDSVFFDDSRVFLNVTPHTLVGSGWVVVDLRSKVYSGDVNLVVGVDSGDLKADGLERFNPHNETFNYTCAEGNFFNYTLLPKHFWCYENVSVGNSSEYSYSLLFDRDFDSGNIPLRTAYWSESVDWTPMVVPITTIPYNFDGKDKWYFAENLPIVSGVDYRVRIHFSVAPTQLGTPVKTYKYDFGIYPSSYGTTASGLLNATANDHLYFIDPWTKGVQGVMAYLRLNNTAVDSVGFYNGTVSATGVSYNASSYVFGGSSAQFAGTNNNSVAISNFSLNNTLTMCVWVYPENASGQKTSEMLFNFLVPGALQKLAINNTGEVQCRFATSGGEKDYADTTINVTFSGWSHICCVHDDVNNKIFLYVNGTNLGNTATGTVTQTALGAYWGQVGSYPTSTSSDFRGRLTGLALFNVSLNSSDVSELYAEGGGLDYPFDTVMPFIDFNVNTTANNSYLANSGLFASINASDDMEVTLINITLWNASNDLVLNSTLSPANTSAQLDVNFTGLTDGVYYLNASVVDYAGNLNMTGTYNYTLDNTAPPLVFNLNTTVVGNLSFFEQLFASVNSTGSEAINISLYNGSQRLLLFNSSADQREVNFSQVTSMTGEGYYYVNASAYDTLGNMNYTDTLVYYVDPNAPFIAFNLNTTLAGVYRNTGIFGSVNASDTFFNFTNLTLFNMTNGLVLNYSGTTNLVEFNFTGLSNGWYYLNATAWDNRTHSNFTAKRLIGLDTAYPVVALNANSTQGSFTGITGLFISVNASDNVAVGLINLTIFDSSGSLVLNLTNTSNSNMNYNFTLPTGSYKYNVTVTDNVSLVNFTNTFNVTLAAVSSSSGGGAATGHDSEVRYNDTGEFCFTYEDGSRKCVNCTEGELFMKPNGEPFCATCDDGFVLNTEGECVVDEARVENNVVDSVDRVNNFVTSKIPGGWITIVIVGLVTLVIGTELSLFKKRKKNNYD